MAIDRAGVIAGGLIALKEEALPAATAAAHIFANAPAGTKAAKLTIRGGTLTLTYISTTPTSTVGHDFGVGTYDFAYVEEELKKMQAIGASVTSGYITYLGVP